MASPLLMEFPVAVSVEATAQAVTAALRTADHDPQIEFDEGEPDEDGVIDPDDEEFGPAWTVYANCQMVPEYQEIIRIQTELNQIAAPLGGKSDGWGVMLG